jgi:hypothetical protein
MQTRTSAAPVKVSYRTLPAADRNRPLLMGGDKMPERRCPEYSDAPQGRFGNIETDGRKKSPGLRGFSAGARSAAYMRAIIASPKPEQDTSVAPSIRRAKS